MDEFKLNKWVYSCGREGIASVRQLPPGILRHEGENERMIYLASPYTHDDMRVKVARFKAASAAGAKLMSDGHLIFGPISMTHPMGIYGGVPTTWDFWAAFDEEYLGLAKELWILTLIGWESSRGVTAETEITERLGKPIRLITPEACGIEDVYPDRPELWLSEFELKEIANIELRDRSFSSLDQGA